MMKGRLAVVLTVLLALLVLFSSSCASKPVSTTALPEPGNISLQLQEDLLEYNYPYSEVSAAEREQLAQYEVSTLEEQIANFQPDQGYTLNYLQNALANMKKLDGIQPTTK